jgi:hypothetical protein
MSGEILINRNLQFYKNLMQHMYDTPYNIFPRTSDIDISNRLDYSFCEMLNIFNNKLICNNLIILGSCLEYDMPHEKPSPLFRQISVLQYKNILTGKPKNEKVIAENIEQIRANSDFKIISEYNCINGINETHVVPTEIPVLPTETYVGPTETYVLPTETYVLPTEIPVLDRLQSFNGSPIYDDLFNFDGTFDFGELPKFDERSMLKKYLKYKTKYIKLKTSLFFKDTN